MATRIPDLPKVIDDIRVKDFLTRFYDLSNDPIPHEEFADLFTADGEYSMNHKKSQRQGRLEPVSLFARRDDGYVSSQRHPLSLPLSHSEDDAAPISHIHSS